MSLFGGMGMTALVAHRFGIRHLVAVLLLMLFGVGSSVAQTTRPLQAADFQEQIPQGFGDRHNSESMSMIWWNDRLFVGTNRANACIQQATIEYYGAGTYPPTEPDVECTPEIADLPLQAEIWRWTPDGNQWDLLYRSPEDLPIPGHPGKFVARDMAFRGMAIFVEPDGTEALYVSGVTARGFNEPGLPPPRILRSVDGEIFEPVPQDPGTFLGDIPYVGFRGIESYQDKFYILASVGDLGHGVILESANPRRGQRYLSQGDAGWDDVFRARSFQRFPLFGTGVQPANNPPTLRSLQDRRHRDTAV